MSILQFKEQKISYNYNRASSLSEISTLTALTYILWSFELTECADMNFSQKTLNKKVSPRANGLANAKIIVRGQPKTHLVSR